MKTESLRFKLTFQTPLLGCASGNPEIHQEFIASKAMDQAKSEEEVAAVAKAIEGKEPLTEQDIAEKVEKASTVFPKDENGLHVWDYQVKGYFKESIGVLIELGEVDLSKWLVKRAVDQFVFTFPRRIYLRNPEGEIIKRPASTLQRPLRASTLQGDRIALARSELLPEGTTAEFEVRILRPSPAKAKTDKKGNLKKGYESNVAIIDAETIRSAMQYGEMHGFLQWRGGGFGRFTFEEKTA